MNDLETRSLRRAALLLLVVSGARWGWQARPRAAPPPGDDPSATLLQESRERVEEAERRARPLEPGERLDPNRAPAEELDRLPGVGPATAAALVAFRDSVGGVRAVGELVAVRGIGPATVERIRPWLDLSTGPPATMARRGSRLGARAGSGDAVPVNRADESLLQSLPGVGPALARRIVEARRIRRFTRVEDLLEVRGIGPATLERIRPLVSVRP
jgi:competence ComEA-like helix-hairpin-helix protein